MINWWKELDWDIKDNFFTPLYEYGLLVIITYVFTFILYALTGINLLSLNCTILLMTPSMLRFLFKSFGSVSIMDYYEGPHPCTCFAYLITFLAIGIMPFTIFMQCSLAVLAGGVSMISGYLWGM